MGFIEGHGETANSVFTGLFVNNNCTVENINLAIGEIGEDVQMLVACGPVKDFLPRSLRSWTDTSSGAAA